MNANFAIWKKNRAVYLNFLDNYSIEALNKIPDGFSNNLIWNIAHVVVTQQLLVYGLSDLPMKVSQELIEKYRKGTRPQGSVAIEEVNEIRHLLMNLVDETITDYNDNLFKNYNRYETSQGFILSNTADAIAFNNYHEGVHLGVILSIKKFI